MNYCFNDKIFTISQWFILRFLFFRKTETCKQSKKEKTCYITYTFTLWFVMTIFTVMQFFSEDSQMTHSCHSTFWAPAIDAKKSKFNFHDRQNNCILWTIAAFVSWIVKKWIQFGWCSCFLVADFSFCVVSRWILVCKIDRNKGFVSSFVSMFWSVDLRDTHRNKTSKRSQLLDCVYFF